MHMHTQVPNINLSEQEREALLLLGGPLEASWGFLGVSWGVLGTPWGCHDASWGYPVAVWGCFGSLLGCVWEGFLEIFGKLMENLREFNGLAEMRKKFIGKTMGKPLEKTYQKHC